MELNGMWGREKEREKCEAGLRVCRYGVDKCKWSGITCKAWMADRKRETQNLESVRCHCIESFAEDVVWRFRFYTDWIANDIFICYCRMEDWTNEWVWYQSEWWFSMPFTCRRTTAMAIWNQWAAVSTVNWNISGQWQVKRLHSCINRIKDYIAKETMKQLYNKEN